MRATTGRSGWAFFAAIAYGMPPPIDSNVPESDPYWRPRSVMSRAYQEVAVPQSTASSASSGRRSESSRTTSSGLSALVWAWARWTE